MKALLALCLSITTFVWTPHSLAMTDAGGGTVKGVVLETMNAGGYTYVRIKTKDGETWAAVNRASVNKGDTVTINNVMVMNDFESKSLKKTFPSILFGTLAGGPANTPTGRMEMAKAHSGLSKSKEASDIQVPKAQGANAHTVEEIITKSGQLKNKTVLVRGKVVKFNPDIMDKNWVHLRDGSGSAAAGTDDILVTTKDRTKVGDIVTAKGTVRANKDFGAGYAYKVIIEEATLQ